MVRNSQCNSISKMATEQYYIWYEMVMVQIHMERNGYGAKYIWYEMVNYGTKRPWYEMVMVRND